MVENGEVLGCVWKAGVLVDSVVADDGGSRLHNGRIVSVTVTALRTSAGAVEPVALEVADCVDDDGQISTRYRGRVLARPADLVV